MAQTLFSGVETVAKSPIQEKGGLSMSKSQERWWISGSHGFLGQQLVEQLNQSGQEPIRGDREGNVTPLWVDYVVNAQSFGNYYWQRSDIIGTYRANVMALARILQNGEVTKGIVHLSSTSVLLAVQTYYSAAKRAGEEMVALAARDKGVPALSVRPSSITGIGEQKEHLIPKLIDSCLNGTEIPFVAEPTHDFVDVSDVARAVIFLAKNAKENAGKTINVSSGVTTTNQEVLEIVERVSGKRANIKPISQLRDYDTGRWEVDNSELVKMGWKPEVPLEESIRRMINAHGK